MFRTWITAAATTATVTATVLTGATANAADAPQRYGQAQLQHDLDAIHDTGVSGVLAQVDTGRQTLRGTSGVADLSTGGPVNPDSYFRIGSNTKTFVSTVVLQL